MPIESINARPFFCSWSGGKDACLALYRAVQAGGRPAYLFTTLGEDGSRSRAHRLPAPLLRRQAELLGLPIRLCPVADGAYEEAYTGVLREMTAAGISAGVFGDIELPEHRDWVDRVCANAGVQAYQPLWQESASVLLEEFLAVGFRTTIVAVRRGVTDEKYLGRVIDADLVREFASKGIDPRAEGGEFHTVVTDGPLFARRLELTVTGQEKNDQYTFLNTEIRGANLSN